MLTRRDAHDGAQRRGYSFVDISNGYSPPLQHNMIIRARTIVTMDEPPIENGAVMVSGNQIDDSLSGSSPSRAARPCRAAPAGSIVDVGKFDQIKKDYAGQIVDLGEQALLPGLINAHCHLDY